MNILTKLIFLACLILPNPSFALNALPFMKDSFLNLRDDLREATTNQKTLMVLYEQDGCPYCIEMHKTTFTDPQIVAILKKNFEVIQLDIWGGREITDLNGVTHTEKDWARKLGIQFSPMIMFFDASGKEIFRIPGYYKPALFSTALNYVAQGQYKTLPFRSYLAQQAPPTAEGTKESSVATSGNLQALRAAAAKSQKGVALLFEQGSCAECSEFRDKTLKRGDIAKKLGSHYEWTAIDIGSERRFVDTDGLIRNGKQLAARYAIQTLPTMIFIAQNGREVLRHDSYLKPEHFLTLLTYLTTDARHKYKSFQDWLRVKNSPVGNKSAAGKTMTVP